MDPLLPLPSRAPLRLAAEIRIHAPPERLWEILLDVERWPLWHRGIHFATLRAGPDGEGSEEPAQAPEFAAPEGHLRTPPEGTRMDWRADGMRLRSTLTLVRPPRVLEWTSRTLAAGAIHRWILTPEGDGVTVVHSEEVWEGLVVRLLRGTLLRTLRRSRTHWLEALKARAEGGS